MNFNYSTLNVSLCPKTRSVRVALNRPENQNTINIEMLFELESLFGWLTTHLEVNAVVLTGEGDTFSAGFDQEELKIMSEEKMQKYLIRFQKIIAGMLSLPQTIICDLKNGAAGMGIELSSGADVRIMRSSGKLEFNSLKKGWVPCSGGVGLLGFWVGHAKARSWTLCSSTIDGAEALNSGYCLSSYANAEDALTPLLTNIAAQAAVARIQTKRSFLEAIMPELTRSFEYETIFSFAALKTQDWKKDQESEDFIAARDMAKLLKDSAQAPVL